MRQPRYEAPMRLNARVSTGLQQWYDWQQTPTCHSPRQAGNPV